jgi:drug/metabolite transporter (DMT)-like permease
MTFTGNFDRRIRKFGLIWIVLAPCVFLMAAISTVRSETTYNIQLAVFTAVAVIAIILGVAALLRRSWSAVGLRALSWLAAAYFFGAATVVLLWPFLPWSQVRTDVASLSLVLMLAVLIAPTGIPFLLMARALGRLIKSLPAETVPRDA